jgi:putative ABC transport system ATP-binding protein
MIELNNVCKAYKNKYVETPALKNINLKIENKDFIAVMGSSGSGKTTLLNIIGGLDTPDSGSYNYDDICVSDLSMKNLCTFRKNKIGFVFQHFELLNKYTVYENVEMPLLLKQYTKKQRNECIDNILEKLHIIEYKNKMPVQLSGGQQQRVAIARAIITGAEVILADEPTGALDKENGRMIMETMKEINNDGKTIVVVTHDQDVADYCNHIIRISDGNLIEEYNKSLKD